MSSAAIASATDSRTICNLLAAASITLPVPAAAQQHALPREGAGITFGAFVADRESTTRLDPASGRGTDVDLERDLGLESRTTAARVGGYVWLKPRQRFDFSLFDLSRDASRRVEKTILFGDEVFEIDAVVDSEASLRILKADYTFAPVSGERAYLGVNAGLYTASMKFSLSQATLGNFESEDLTAPLPVAGLRMEYAITPRLSLNGAAQWFRVDVAELSGRLSDVHLAADYALGRRLAVGLAYNDVSANVTAEEPGGFLGSLDWGYDGWWLYLKARLGE